METIYCACGNKLKCDGECREHNLMKQGKIKCPAAYTEKRKNESKNY